MEQELQEQQTEQETQVEDVIPFEPSIEKGIPLPRRVSGKGRKSTVRLSVDKLNPPELREGMNKEIRKDMELHLLNKYFILESFFCAEKIQGLTRIIRQAEEANGAQYVARSVTESHGGIEVSGSRIWRVF